MTGAEVLAWLVIGWFFVGTTWDVLDPDAIKLTINSWARAGAALLVQIAALVAAAHVLALSAAMCVTLVAFFIIALLLAALRQS